ncbi:DUF4129 domain-containing protein [Oscillochloris sp. ZM17-4]|uniref:DUF4129 domain-containing protein n=1 Tax=Oscillochloris sp. ZM17-4 TaxID=2866714 RepID=UPI001C72B0E2|nr:DUF4129 domain-containing protein [Oscillochloris sp. ZM17-4]MBX0327011.1 DUF4129 domain-containing protein [Oscillochloris sp. ZM17-4]
MTSPTQPEPRLNLPAALLLAALFASLTLVLSGVLVRALPGWRPGYIVAASFVVAVEAALIRYRMRRDRDLIASGLSYMAAELFALAVLMRAVASLSQGLAGLPAMGQLWLRSPLAALDDIFFVFLAAGLAVGLLVRWAMIELDELEPRGESRPSDSTIDTDVFRSAAEGRQIQSLSRLSAGLAWGGVIILVGLVAQVVNVSRIGGPPLALSASSGAAGMIYLLCAMTLYSRARLGLLRARWHLDGSEVEPGVLRGWGRSSLAVILCVGLLTLFLPRSYGMSLLDAMRGSGVAALNILAVIMIDIGLLVIALMGLLLSIPAMLLALLGFGAGGGGGESPVVPQPIAAPPAPDLVRDPPLLPALIFWACVVILAGYAIWLVARRQDWAGRAAYWLRTGALARLWAALSALWSGTRRYARQVGAALAERARGPDGGPSPRARFRLRGLSPGELVRYFYLSTLRRAEGRGIGRRRAQTPREYESQLRGHLPEAADDIAALTDAYEAAAYAPRPAAPEDARRARPPWERLRRILRGPRSRDS